MGESPDNLGIFLGIDPGLVCTGLAVINAEGGRPRLVAARTVTTEAKEDLTRRLGEIHASVADFAAQYKPAAVAIEEVFSQTRFPQSAIMLAHARGAILAAIAGSGVLVEEIPARRLKKAITGSGRAGKAQVTRMVERQLGLPRPLDNEHVADAAALALYLFIQSNRGTGL